MEGMVIMFSERLKELREAEGVTQSDIAKLLNTSIQNISYYEKGREPNYTMLKKLAEYFGVTTDYLTGYSNFKNSEEENEYIKFKGEAEIEKEPSKKTEAHILKIIKPLNETILNYLDIANGEEINLFESLVVEIQRYINLMTYISSRSENYNSISEDNCMDSLLDMIAKLDKSDDECRENLLDYGFESRWVESFLQLRHLEGRDFEKKQIMIIGNLQERINNLHKDWFEGESDLNAGIVQKLNEVRDFYNNRIFEILEKMGTRISKIDSWYIS